MSRIGTLQGIVNSEETNIGRLRLRLAGGNADRAAVERAMEEARLRAEGASITVGRLDGVHTHATKKLTNPGQRCIGRVHFAERIGPSSSAPDGFTVDWATVLLNPDALADGFTGNNVFIGTSPLPSRPAISSC